MPKAVKSLLRRIRKQNYTPVVQWHGRSMGSRRRTAMLAGRSVVLALNQSTLLSITVSAWAIPGNQRERNATEIQGICERSRGRQDRTISGERAWRSDSEARRISHPESDN
jgi:hypothetical protein